MPIGMCTVSGTLLTASGAGIPGATVKATTVRPFLYSATGDLIANSEASTTTANDGTWSLTLVETTTDNVTMTISFVYPPGASAASARKDYTVQIPNTATATFQSLIGTQV